MKTNTPDTESDTPKRGRGRPMLSKDSAQVVVLLPSPMLDAIEAIIAERMDRPSRAVVVRELLAEALAARQTAKA